MDSPWEKLEKVHSRIAYLEQKKLRMYTHRAASLRERATGRSASFSGQLYGINEELVELWDEKRYLLTLLEVPARWSWISPVIPNLGASPGRLRMSKRDPVGLI